MFFFISECQRGLEWFLGMPWDMQHSFTKSEELMMPRSQYWKINSSQLIQPINQFNQPMDIHQDYRFQTKTQAALGVGHFLGAAWPKAKAAALSSMGQASGAFGGLLGGIIGDRLSRCCPLHGRPLTAQISVLSEAQPWRVGYRDAKIHGFLIFCHETIKKEKDSQTWILVELFALGLEFQ